METCAWRGVYFYHERGLKGLLFPEGKAKGFCLTECFLFSNADNADNTDAYGINAYRV